MISTGFPTDPNRIKITTSTEELDLIRDGLALLMIQPTRYANPKPRELLSKVDAILRRFEEGQRANAENRGFFASEHG